MKIKQRSEWIHTYLLRVSFGHICLVRKTTKNTHTVSRIIFIKIVDAGSAYPLLIENRRKIGVVYDLHQLELWSVTTASHIEILHDTFIYVYATFLAFSSTKDCDYIMRQLCLCRWYTAAYAPSIELGVIDRAIINQTDFRIRARSTTARGKVQGYLRVALWSRLWQNFRRGAIRFPTFLTLALATLSRRLSVPAPPFVLPRGSGNSA